MPLLDASDKWNHTICDLLCLVLLRSIMSSNFTHIVACSAPCLSYFKINWKSSPVRAYKSASFFWFYSTNFKRQDIYHSRFQWYKRCLWSDSADCFPCPPLSALWGEHTCPGTVQTRHYFIPCHSKRWETVSPRVLIRNSLDSGWVFLSQVSEKLVFPSQQMAL